MQHYAHCTRALQAYIYIPKICFVFEVLNHTILHIRFSPVALSVTRIDYWSISRGTIDRKEVKYGAAGGKLISLVLCGASERKNIFGKFSTL